MRWGYYFKMKIINKHKSKHLKKKEKRIWNKQNSKIEISEEMKENLETIEKEIKIKNYLPQEETEKISKKVFENILIADIVMIFLYFLSLGSINIESNIFITDLKVFSISLIIFTILLFEYSYRKENLNIFIHGLECFVSSLFILFSAYIYTFYLKEFDLIVTIVSCAFAVYYVLKSVIIGRRIKKQYFVNTSDINEIIKK